MRPLVVVALAAVAAGCGPSENEIRARALQERLDGYRQESPEQARARREAIPAPFPVPTPVDRGPSAQDFVRGLTWTDMEPVPDFTRRLPAGIRGSADGRTGETRRLRFEFPGGGAIILLARPCEGFDGLCVWAVDVED